MRGELTTGFVKHSLSASASAFEQRSRNAYGMSDFSGWASNLYQPLDVAAPPADFYRGGALAEPLLTDKAILDSQALADTVAMFDGRLRLTIGARHQAIKGAGYDYNSGPQILNPDEVFAPHVSRQKEAGVK